ncbi:PadR family transcriptional regulator [Rathayibacter sp. AY1A3]|uniref:PadR family transcriptional regulator n=1 Tax=Rathayibacter sp. AY1A3 TaxID=2080521 RepID=UPI000CE8D524|nr:helix-turn-helix transcriptional regulator [Rathayibacter sp. AY1A3]PPF36323.1 PadR family transcriptional regulator [Rathayibacter sp. AY1A3]
MQPLPRLTSATADVLRTLLDADGPTWGMVVIKATGRPAGSVYPILERLEGAGWVVSEWEAASERSGPRRRLYELTAEGAPAARAAVERMRSIARTAPRAAEATA